MTFYTKFTLSEDEKDTVKKNGVNYSFTYRSWS